jgi:hypothetical protein
MGSVWIILAALAVEQARASDKPGSGELSGRGCLAGILDDSKGERISAVPGSAPARSGIFLKRPRPPVLEKRPRPPEPFEFKAYGGFLLDSTDLSHLPEGEYIYLIDEDLNVAFAPRDPVQIDPDAPGAVYLATHEGLEGFMHQHGTGKKILAGGQVWVGPQHRVKTLDNKSGRWRGGQEHLDFAEEVLVAYGLPMTERTRRRDRSKDVRPDGTVREDHTKEGQQVALQMKYPALLRRMRNLENGLAELFPHPEWDGYPDVGRIRRLIMQKDPSALQGKMLGQYNQLVSMSREEMPGGAIAQLILKAGFTPKEVEDIIVYTETFMREQGPGWPPPSLIKR